MPLQTIVSHQISSAIVLLLIVLMTHGTCGRQDMGAYIARQELPQLFLEELLEGANENTFYNELKKYHHNQPNYNSKWPGLRNLLLTADYDESLESSDYSNSNARFLERLRQLAANNVDMEEAEREGNILGASNNDMQPTPTPIKQLTAGATFAGVPKLFKDHGAKKNVQYMSPCHFKICNMGRKRNARLFDNF